MGVVPKLPKKVLKTVGTRRLVVLTALSVLLSFLLTYFAGVTDLLARVQAVTLPGVAVTLGPEYVVAVPAAVVTLVVGIVVLEVVDEVGEFLTGEERKKRKEQWAKIPTPAQAVLVGLPFGVVAIVAMLLTVVLTAVTLPDPLLLVVGAGVWLGISFFTYRHILAEEELARWLKQLVAGGVGATVLALGIAAVDVFLFASSLPGYGPLLVFLVGGPVVTALVMRQIRREEEGLLSELLVKSGVAQLQQLETATVALAFGFLAAVLAGVVVSVVGAGLTLTAAVFVLVWLAGSVAAYQWSQRSGEARSDLVIADVYERSTGGRRELSVRNESDEVIDLRNAKIRDTEHDLYRTNIEVVLGAGQTGKFDIPQEFSLFPREDSIARDLPLGVSISQHADSPVVVTRNGQKFELQWADGVEPADGAGGRETDGETSNDHDDRTGVGSER